MQDSKASVKKSYTVGDLVIVKTRALSQSDSAFFVGLILTNQKDKRSVREHDDMWCTKELIWEKVYKVMAQGRIIDVNHYSIEGKLF